MGNTKRAETNKHKMNHVVNISWTLFKLSPLFGFSIHSFNEYCSEFQKFLQQLDVNPYKRYKISFDFIEDFKNESDEHALHVIAVNEKNQIDLNIILYSVSQCDNTKKFTYIPILFIDGNNILREEFLSFLQNRFDCLVTPIFLSTRDMLILGLMGLNSNYAAENEFSLSFKLPRQVTGSNSVHLSIKADDCYKLWNRILEKEKNTDLRIDLFASSINRHFTHFFKLSLSVCQMYEISSPFVFVSEDGILKVLDPDLVKPIFNHLRLLLTDVELVDSVM